MEWNGMAQDGMEWNGNRNGQMENGQMEWNVAASPSHRSPLTRASPRLDLGMQPCSSATVHPVPEQQMVSPMGRGCTERVVPAVRLPGPVYCGVPRWVTSSRYLRHPSREKAWISGTCRGEPVNRWVPLNVGGRRQRRTGIYGGSMAGQPAGGSAGRTSPPRALRIPRRQLPDCTKAGRTPCETECTSMWQNNVLAFGLAPIRAGFCSISTRTLVLG